MALKKLIQTPETIDVQQTTFSIDVLARYCCNTLEEVEASGINFDYIVIGSGMYGGYCAAKLNRLAKIGNKPVPKVLILEAGPFLISEHVQNLSRIGYSIFKGIVGKPYVSKIKEPGVEYRHEPVADHYYCVGGKSLGWGKWSPRLTDKDLLKWPPEVANYLKTHYSLLEEEMGVWPSADFILGVLFEKLKGRVKDVLNNTATDFVFADDLPFNLDPPIAIQGQSPASGLFSFDAFSSINILIDAIREDVEQSGGNDQNRSLFLVPYSKVFKLNYHQGKTTGLNMLYGQNGTVRYLSVNNECKVILGCNSMESTRLALYSLLDTDYPNRLLVGKNLMAHLRSNMTVRMKRESISVDLDDALQTAALHIQGEVDNRRFHVQFFASSDPHGDAEAVLYRVLPDLDYLKQVLEAQKSEWITIKILTVGEMIERPENWMNLSPYEYDLYGGVTLPKAYVNWNLIEEDDDFWSKIDSNALDLAEKVAGGTGHIEYFHRQTNTWSTQKPLNVRQFRDSLGSTFHESGTLKMGMDASQSVTDTSGKFHAIDNLYCIDQSIFPSVGSANPVLTGLTLTRKIVEDLLHLV